MNYGKAGIRRRQEQLNARGPKWARKLLLLLVELVLVAIIAIGVIGAAAGIGVFKGILASAPDITNITVTPSGRSSFVYDREGNQIAKLVSANANRIPVSYDKITKDMEHAFVAIEDERFYTHNGIDIQGIIRAAVKAIKNRKLGQGASTIDQQLLKNNVFTNWTEEETTIEKVKRKVQEQYLAIQLEKISSKEEIITNYLNTINLGHNTLGVEAASLRYFGKHCNELNLSECTVIAAITQNPSKFDPIIHPDKNSNRRTDVINNMLRLGYITEAEKTALLADDVYSRITESNSVEGESAVTSYFVDALTEEVYDDLLDAGYNENQVYALMYSGGIKIHATQDPKMQKICDEEVANEENFASCKWLLDYRLTIQKADGTLENHSSEMFRSYFRQTNKRFNMLYNDKEAPYEDIKTYQEAVMEEGDEILAESIEITVQPQISFTLMDQHTGEVLAMVGGRGEKTVSKGFNRATMAERQPGSCFKVLAAFAPAIDACGKTLASVYNDAPFNYYDGTPVSNWYGKDEYLGLCNLRYGVYWSLNVVAVKTITEITPELAFQYLLDFGFTTLEEGEAIGDLIYTDITQPLALGGITHGITNYEITAAYAAIANMGEYIKPKMYTYIEDADGNIILDNREKESHRVIKETTAFLLTDAMKDCVTRGTGTRARFSGMSIAGKTGTTSDSLDIWFCAFTPYYTASCWTGYDNNVELTDPESRVGQIYWKAVMERIHENLEDPGFEVPEGIVRCTVCKQSGLLPNALCTDCYSEYFTKDTVPTETCNVHYMGRVCGYDNLPATDLCPFAYEGAVQMLPPESEALQSGKATVGNDALDPLHTGTAQSNTGYCHHDEAFFSQPDWETRYYQEAEEYQRRVEAVWQAQQAAAEAQPSE